jgi:hypothetical protein
MALVKGWSGGVLIGIGAALAAPVILPVAGAVVKPLAKGLIWGYLAASDKLKEVMAETREQMNDIIAETKAEYADGSGVPAARKARPINA